MKYYYDIPKHWRKVKKAIAQDHVQDVLVRDMTYYTHGRWQEPFLRGDIPAKYNSVDWDWDVKHKPFHDYVCAQACHWLVNFNLEVAQLVEPERDWRIVESEEHSTVWDGHETIFDFNFLAFQIPVEECWYMVIWGEVHSIGQHIDIGLPE